MALTESDIEAALAALREEQASTALPRLEVLEAYARGELTEGERARVRRALEVYPDLAAAVEMLTNRGDPLLSAGQAALDAALQAHEAGRGSASQGDIPNEPPDSPPDNVIPLFRRLLKPAAALAAAAAVFFVIWPWHSATLDLRAGAIPPIPTVRSGAELPLLGEGQVWVISPQRAGDLGHMLLIEVEAASVETLSVQTAPFREVELAGAREPGVHRLVLLYGAAAFDVPDVERRIVGALVASPASLTGHELHFGQLLWDALDGKVGALALDIGEPYLERR